ncbi:MAG TPA: prefoldin subunit alpha [Candidatus Nanopusillus sp.]|nr:prefoldin subunit alpha [Candidatus Nanopusillus sp.]
MEKSELLELYYSLKEEYEGVIKKIAEFELLKEGLKELKTGETYINFGGMLFLKAKILDVNNILVNIGNNIFIEKSRDDIIKILEDNIKNLENLKKDLESQIEEIKEKIKNLK